MYEYTYLQQVLQNIAGSFGKHLIWRNGSPLVLANFKINLATRLLTAIGMHAFSYVRKKCLTMLLSRVSTPRSPGSVITDSELQD